MNESKNVLGPARALCFVPLVFHNWFHPVPPMCRLTRATHINLIGNSVRLIFKFVMELFVRFFMHVINENDSDDMARTTAVMTRGGFCFRFILVDLVFITYDSSGSQVYF